LAEHYFYIILLDKTQSIPFRMFLWFRQ